MIPQKQLYRRNNVAAGEFGDCHRTCIAMILNLPRDDVPHFMSGVDPATPPDDPVWTRCEDAEIAWLSRRYGLTPVNVAFPGETPLPELLEVVSNLAHGAPVILGCMTARGNHSVVIHDGRLYNPNDNEVLGPMQDGFWWLTIYSVGRNWRSPRLFDRLKDLLRRLRNPRVSAAG